MFRFLKTTGPRHFSATTPVYGQQCPTRLLGNLATLDTGGLGGVGFRLLARTERTDGLAGLPHFAVVHVLKLLGHEFLVVGAAGVADDFARFLHLLRRLVELLEDGLGRLAEVRPPLERAVLRGLRAVRVHPVHAVLVDEAGERLGEFFASFVERFGRAVAVLAESVVLRFHDAAERTHEDAALADEVGGYFILERGREEIARADGDTDGERQKRRVAGRVLGDGERRVDARAVEEVAADVSARALGRDHDDVHVRTGLDAGQFVVDVGETVR